MGKELGTPEFYADMLIVGNTGGVDVSAHNLSVIKAAMLNGSINALSGIFEPKLEVHS